MGNSVINEAVARDGLTSGLSQIGKAKNAAAVGVSLLAVLATGCGASSNSAPVVYGTEPAQGRIYNSPAEIYLERPARTGTLTTNRALPGRAVPATGQVSSAYGTPQAVRIYDRPPSAGTVTTSPTPLVQAPVAQVPLQQVPDYTPRTTYVSSEQRVQSSTPYGDPTYRGLPPAPVYLTGERANNTASSPYGTPAATSAPAPGYGYDPQIGAAASFITVEPGDTVFAIARKTGFQPKDIIVANNLYAPYNLSIGQTLRLPTAQGASPAVTPVSVPVSARAYTAPSVTSAAPSYREVIARDVLYTVAAGDTLYSIARRHNVAVQAITEANRLSSPFSLAIGQQLLLPAVPTGAGSKAASTRTRSATRQRPARAPTTAYKTPAPQKAVPAKNIETLTRQASYTAPKTATLSTQFSWPIKGALVSTFGANGIGRRNDGINIAATLGAPVRAAADGEVVYRGSELDGYGNLLLIKHDGGFVTAYAHNDAMVVRKGQKVRKGQIIAKVGKSGAVSEPQLHFEIRQNLKSLDPMQFLASN
ncbi:MAG: peptidoglycan DD-metalloendopeptidase family protein [Pseudomonadota bacterium]